MMAKNVETHTGTVHRARWVKGQALPLCMSVRQGKALHYSSVTSKPVTCTKCAAK